MGSELAMPETRSVTAGQNTAVERRDASRTVLRYARDRDDLQQLLAALGLNNPKETSPVSDNDGMTNVDAPALALPQIAVDCPACGADAGALCTSHSGTRVRKYDMHQARRDAWTKEPPPARN
ncbi:hypothetical protein [Streptomyces sp. NPDC057302]|uniref:zinc finger domain-containing protein n=1 Tax=Streptomyces sp. NPDC057302 TaxID=3346094 RepID=UPI00362FA702